MTPRYRTRIQANFPVIITLSSHASEGRILDLTVPGCLIESPLVTKKGDYLQLRMLLLGYTSVCSVALAAVRWAKGSQFGVEFIKMTAQDQRQLHYVIARHRSHRALT